VPEEQRLNCPKKNCVPQEQMCMKLCWIIISACEFLLKYFQLQSRSPPQDLFQ
jgi:hypothetical protein